MPSTAMKVGELAKQTGVSVRTLHYYDEIGLLSPSLRTDADHRLYTRDDLVRLQQIVSLRQLGFSLEEIGKCLASPTFSFEQVIQLHITRLKEQMELSHKLLNQLEAIAFNLRSAKPVTVEDLIQTIEVTIMFEKYYTPEQLTTIKERQEKLGEERIQQAEAEWQELIAQVRAEMEKGTDPASQSVQILAQRWLGLIQEFTNGDSLIEQSLQTMYQHEGVETASQGTFDVAVMEYMGRAISSFQQASSS